MTVVRTLNRVGIDLAHDLDSVGGALSVHLSDASRVHVCDARSVDGDTAP